MNFKLERTPLEVHPLNAKPTDRAWWMSRTPDERFEALEYLRQLAYGYDPSTERLQRILEVVTLERR